MDFFNNLSIKFKVIIICLLGPLAIAVIFGIQLSENIKAGAYEGVTNKSRAIVLMAESIRNQMAKKIELGVITPFDEIDEDKILEVVPVVSAMKTVQENMEAGDYEFRAPKVSPRNPKNKPTELEKAVLKELKEKGLSEKIIYEKNQIRYFRPIKLTKECLFCHGDPKGERDVTGGIKEGWKEGEIHGAFEIITSLEKTNKKIVREQFKVAGLAFIIVLFIGALSWLLIKFNLLNPLSSCSNFIKTIAEGNLRENLELKNKDEFAVIAKDLNTMKTSLQQMLGEILETTGVLSKSSRYLTETSMTVDDKVNNTLVLSDSVAVGAEEMSANMASVSAATEETSTSITSVSIAAEEYKSAVDEIAKNTEIARDITNKGVQQSANISEKITELEKSIQEINKITETINDISSQTNLLALNATIEAARAGEAGKGFAVVANEVKNLSKQTSEATEDIKRKIEDVQASARENMEEIKEISRNIEEISSIVCIVASAVEEQSATTENIVTNMSHGAQGLEEVARNVAECSTVTNETTKDISEVNKAMKIIAATSSDLKENSENLNKLEKQLTELVKKFKI